MCARPCLDFVHPDDIEPALAIAEALKRGETALDFANRYRTRMDGWREPERCSTVRTAHGPIHAALRDITGERRAGAHLEALGTVARIGTRERDPAMGEGYWP